MHIYTFFLLFNVVMTVQAKPLNIKYGVEAPTPNTIGLRFFTNIENNNDMDYSVDVHPDSCCLYNNDTKCNIINIVGSTNEVIGPGLSKTLVMVAPLLNPFERKGYCTLLVDSRPISRPKDIARDTVKIKFNTRVKKSLYYEDLKHCRHIDEDPLDNCNSVNCDYYYNGKRTHFSIIKKVCEVIPTCVSRSTIYNPVSNKCNKLPIVTKSDIDYVKHMPQYKHKTPVKNIVNNLRHGYKIKDGAQNNEMSVEIDDNGTNEGVAVHINKLKPKPKSTLEAIPIKEHTTCISIETYKRKYTITALVIVILMQLCLICMLVYCVSKTCGCLKKQPVINTYMCHTRDASVTTPLICTSNADTETTDNQYSSESLTCNDKKIKCYKACQKERNSNPKLSMSDDILSKCINRRVWNRLTSELISDVNKDDEHTKSKKDLSNSSKKGEIKVNFKEECRDINSNLLRSPENDDDRIKIDLQKVSAEREICCHSYDTYNAMTGLSNNYERNLYSAYNQDERAINLVGTGEQTYLSNDTLDDFLIERDITSIENDMSKYSFTIPSPPKSLTSQFSKTSGKDIVGNIKTLFTKKCRCSDINSKDVVLGELDASTSSVFSSD